MTKSSSNPRGILTQEPLPPDSSLSFLGSKHHSRANNLSPCLSSATNFLQSNGTTSALPSPSSTQDFPSLFSAPLPPAHSFHGHLLSVHNRLRSFHPGLDL